LCVFIFYVALHDALPISELAIGEQDSISYHRLPDLQQLRACPLSQECDEVSCLEYHADGKQIAVGTMSSMLLVCSTQDARDCLRSEEHTSELQSRENLVC